MAACFGIEIIPCSPYIGQAMVDFDTAKSPADKAKHGIDCVAAQALWLDGLALRVQVPRPVLTETQWLVIGRIGWRRRVRISP